MDSPARPFRFAQADPSGHHLELSLEIPREEESLPKQSEPRASMKDKFGALDRASCSKIRERGARFSLLNRQRFHDAAEQF
jgi:hypothetical protein